MSFYAISVEPFVVEITAACLTLCKPHQLTGLLAAKTRTEIHTRLIHTGESAVAKWASLLLSSSHVPFAIIPLRLGNEQHIVSVLANAHAKVFLRAGVCGRILPVLCLCVCVCL